MVDARSFESDYLDEVRRSFRGYKRLADGGLVQLTDPDFFKAPDTESNCVAQIVKHVAGNLRSRGPASLAVCAMLRKPGSAQMQVDVRYTGFDIGDEFVVGYGLDYAQRYRNLPFIGTLAPAVYGGD